MRHAAIILVDAQDHESALEWQRRDNEQRNRMTPAVCQQMSAAMCDAVYIYVEKSHAGCAPEHRRAALRDSFPGYTTIRNYLAFDAGASYVVACRTAFAAAEGHNRYATREWGWL